MNPLEASHDPGRVTGADRGKFVWLRRRPGLQRRMRSAVLALPLSLPVQNGAAQDCTISRNDWDDIERFRSCIEEQGLEAWSPWVLHQAARLTGNPTVVHLLLEAGADPSARDDQGQTPLHQGVRNANPMVTRYIARGPSAPHLTLDPEVHE